MARIVYLVDDTYIKNNTAVETNVDGKLLRVSTLNAQVNSLQPILGVTLYNKVIEYAYEKMTNSSAIVIPTPYDTLIDSYIRPYLAHATVRDFLIVNNYKVSNSGVQKLRGDSADNISSQELLFFQDYFDNTENNYKASLIDFLKEHKLITSAEEVDQDLTSSSTGWFLDK